MAGAQEVPAVGREVEADERRGTLGDRARLVLAIARQAVLELGEPLRQRLGSYDLDPAGSTTEERP